MKRLLLRVLLAIIAVLASQNIQAQRIALRTNVLDWAILSPNLTLETRLNSRISLGLGVAGNPVHIKVLDTSFRNFRFQPELRYWFNRPMARHYLGIAGLISNFDFHHNKDIKTGDVFAAGLTYGYVLVLGRHWNVEFTAGAGIGRLRYFNYTLPNHIPDAPNCLKWSIIPMNIGISFAYIIK